MTFEALFDFTEYDLYTNRTGWLSASQKERWQQALSISWGFQRIGPLIIGLVLGGILLGSVRYIGSFFPEIPPEAFAWVKAVGIVMIAFAAVPAVWGFLATSRRFRDFEAHLEAGKVKRLTGRVQLMRVFQWDSSDSYGSGYVYMMFINGQEIRVSSAAKMDGEVFGQALFAVFGLPLPPKQGTMQQMRHVPQTAETHETYTAYCLDDGWGKLLMCSIERAEE